MISHHRNPNDNTEMPLKDIHDHTEGSCCVLNPSFVLTSSYVLTSGFVFLRVFGQVVDSQAKISTNTRRANGKGGKN